MTELKQIRLYIYMQQPSKTLLHHGNFASKNNGNYWIHHVRRHVWRSSLRWSCLSTGGTHGPAHQGMNAWHYHWGGAGEITLVTKLGSIPGGVMLEKFPFPGHQLKGDVSWDRDNFAKNRRQLEAVFSYRDGGLMFVRCKRKIRQQKKHSTE